MSYNVELQLAGILVIVTLGIVFFSKPRWKSIQNSIFRVLLIVTFFELILDEDEEVKPVPNYPSYYPQEPYRPAYSEPELVEDEIPSEKNEVPETDEGSDFEMNPELEEPETFDSPLVQSSPASMPQATVPAQSVSEPSSDSIVDVDLPLDVNPNDATTDSEENSITENENISSSSKNLKNLVESLQDALVAKKYAKYKNLSNRLITISIIQFVIILLLLLL